MRALWREKHSVSCWLVDTGATDATLIALAERTGIAAIATIDQRDFSIYRIKGRKRFRILIA